MGFLLRMNKVFFKIMDIMTKDCCLYWYNDEIWLINPKTKEWVVSYYTKTKYVWWNYSFFYTVNSLLTVDNNQKELIKSWVESKLGVDVGKNVEPDMVPHEYNWSSDFNVLDTMENGKILNYWRYENNKT